MIWTFPHSLDPQASFFRTDAQPESFVPVVVEVQTSNGSARKASPSPVARPHAIELDVEGSSVFIWPGAEVGMVKAIIGALKASK